MCVRVGEYRPGPGRYVGKTSSSEQLRAGSWRGLSVLPAPAAPPLTYQTGPSPTLIAPTVNLLSKRPVPTFLGPKPPSYSPSHFSSLQLVSSPTFTASRLHPVLLLRHKCVHSSRPNNLLLSVTPACNVPRSLTKF